MSQVQNYHFHNHTKELFASPSSATRTLPPLASALKYFCNLTIKCFSAKYYWRKQINRIIWSCSLRRTSNLENSPRDEIQEAWAQRTVFDQCLKLMFHLDWALAQVSEMSTEYTTVTEHFCCSGRGIADSLNPLVSTGFSLTLLSIVLTGRAL